MVETEKYLKGMQDGWDVVVVKVPVFFVVLGGRDNVTVGLRVRSNI